MILGTDVSFYQRDTTLTSGIDFGKMYEAGAKFTIIRAGQNSWVDRDFHYNWSRAKGKINRGSYWFYDSRTSPKVQAKLWTDQLTDPGEIDHFGDFEENYGGPYGGWRNFKIFMEEAQSLKPNLTFGVYTAYYYWLSKTSDITSGGLNYFKNMPLWVANYDTTTPLVPRPWKSWDYWQWTDKGPGKEYGVESFYIDLNYKVGEVPPIEEGEDIMNKYEAVVISNGTRLRTDHNTFATVISSHGAGAVVSGNQIWEAPSDGQEVKKGDIWIFVTHVNGNPLDVDGWMAVVHKGTPICRDLVIRDGTTPPSGELPVLSVVVSGEGYKTVTVDLEPE